jgi:tRNA (guanine37-N1)-methyltransferase
MEGNYKEICVGVSMHGEKASQNPNFRDLLAHVLTPKELEQAIYSYDVLGNMAMIEIPRELQHKKKQIASALLHAVKAVDSVYEKSGDRAGKYRLKPLRHLAGKELESVSYKEWNCIFEVAPGKVFFSPRLSTERQRVASYVKRNESVAVFFAGVGPYAITIAKHAKPKQVFALEWNPAAMPYLEHNIRHNKVDDIVIPIHADVKKVTHIFGQCDHVIMPAPETATKYLPQAVKCLSPRGGLIHCYGFVTNKQPLHAMWGQLEKGLKSVRGKAHVKEIRKVLQYSPQKVQMCAVIHVPGVKKKTSKAASTKTKKSSAKRLSARKPKSHKK